MAQEKTELLIADLSECEATTRRNRLITDAKKGKFHDYISASATPKVDLFRRCMAAGLTSIASNVQDGKYDDPASECPPEVRESLIKQLTGEEASDG